MAVSVLPILDNARCIVESMDLSPEARQYVLQALAEVPSRKVGEFATTSVATNYLSVRQGFSVQSESHGAELAFILRWEYDDDVIVYLDQPPPVEIRKADKKGRLRRTTYTPDFLLITRSAIWIIEVKREKQLVELSSKYPEQWLRSDEEWIYEPARAAFASLGLPHVVWNASGLSRIKTSNLKAMIRVANSDISVSEATRLKTVRCLECQAWMTLAALKHELRLSSYSPLLQLLHEKVIFADLEHALLAKPDATIVSTSADIVAIAIGSISHPPDESRPVVSTGLVPSRKAAERALFNLERVATRKGRHERRLRKRIAAGVRDGLTPFQALIWNYRGNTSCKLSDPVRTYLEQHIAEQLKHKLAKSITAAHSDYKQKARREHPRFEPVSRKTYFDWHEKIDAQERAKAKGGKRSENAARPPSDVEDREMVATRPFERGCIDHMLLKLFAVVVESNGRVYVKRPWLTALIDAYSDFWLAFFLSFEAPSRKSLAMVFRNCVREHGRVPEFMHSDRGAELRSTYYQSLLAHIGSSPDWNPAANSRFNGQSEMINGLLNKKYVAQRPGNLIDYDNRRKYSKGYRPPDLAVLRLSEIFAELLEIRAIYNSTVVGVESEPPDQRFGQCLADFDFSGVPAEYDDAFVVASAVDTRHSEYKISAQGEILYNNLHFSHPELRRIRPKKSHVEVRVDPENPYKVYCRADGNWVTALSGRCSVFQSGSAEARWGEAVRVAEGRAVRDFAKDYANEIVAEAIESFDQRLSDSPGDNVVKFPSPVGDAAPDNAAVFDRLRGSDIDELDTEDRQ